MSREDNNREDTDLPMIKDRTNAQTGNWVGQTSMEMIPKTNIETEQNRQQLQKELHTRYVLITHGR